ncbi:hypothetical protein [Streptomyces cylindrosporus]|uniref:Large membrane protein n=1 Tax=Streptomyces cylindrosporus TaxID=2927583 RepID=A0ABS9XZ99_9ACTN|nr:hypothetical protein [Streptomyces cylindrosporus]MCI3270277.1 hypothetical protein [Streptomyces cylindrosporus]
MNTERPDNDAAGSAEKRGDGEEQRATGAGAPGGTEADSATPERAAAVEAGADGGSVTASTESGGGDAGGGVTDAGGAKAETTGAGENEAGGAGTGATDAGDVEVGTTDAGDVEVGTADAGDVEAGTTDAGDVEVGTADAGGPEASATTPAEASGSPTTSPTEVPGPHETPSGSPRPPRRRSPALVASVAAAVLLVGGGGAYLAASASGGGGGGTGSGASGDGGTPPPLELDGYSGGNGIAPGEPNPYGVTYKADGDLPGGPGSAAVYKASGEVTKDEVARLAKALGLDGAPVARGQAWQVGPSKDGSGPSLVVNKQAPGTWTFHRYAAGTDACQSTIVCQKDPANPANDTVSEEAAKKAAAPILKAVGQDDAKVDASQVMGAQRAVNADPVVGGLPTYGWTTGLTVSAQGEVVGGSGQLKAPVKGDTYPVLGAKKTLELLNTAPTVDHRMGIGGCATPVPLKDRLEAPCGQGTSAATASAAPTQNTVTVEKAVFGLASHTVGGQPALVPSWLFEVRASGAQDPFTVTYPAIDPKYLASNTPSGEPSSAPATRDIKVDGYVADGNALTVTFTGGVCGDYDAKATEGSAEVTVTVTETPWQGKVCIMIAKEMTKTVQLDEPLGDRKVVGSDGKEIPQVKPGARLPRTTAGVQ